MGFRRRHAHRRGEFWSGSKPNTAARWKPQLCAKLERLATSCALGSFVGAPFSLTYPPDLCGIAPGQHFTEKQTLVRYGDYGTAQYNSSGQCALLIVISAPSAILSPYDHRYTKSTGMTTPSRRDDSTKNPKMDNQILRGTHAWLSERTELVHVALDSFLLASWDQRRTTNATGFWRLGLVRWTDLQSLDRLILSQRPAALVPYCRVKSYC